MTVYLRLILIFLLSCQSRQNNTTSTNSRIDTFEPSETTTPATDTVQGDEFFADSLTIGRKSLNKIEVSKYSGVDTNYVVIKFYSKQNDKWNLRNLFEFSKDGITSCDTKLSDFNNDGLNDITYISAVAARSANEVRRLFIYDKANDKLVYIKNSEDYPNMLYNKDLNCIDAFLVHGGTSTIFLKIEGDSLKEFASVHNDSHRTIYIIDKNGEEKLLRKDKITDEGVYVRYKNFNPPQPYEE